MAKILIIEDDTNISELIEDMLLLAGYEVTRKEDGNSGLKSIEQNSYDLVILDIMLPLMDGFQIMERIKNRKLPVLFLSAKNDAESVVKGLKLGAQDYIRKPFDRIELLTRIELILKRQDKNQKIYKFKNIQLDTVKHVVYLEGVIIDLRPKEYELLELLVKNINIALSRDRILDIVWGVAVDIETRTVDYHIKQIRKKLNLKKEIVTVNKVGYRLEL